MPVESPSLRHHKLTIELRRLRKEADLTREQVAEAMEWSPSRVTRIETGRWRRLQAREVRDLCHLYGVTDQGEQERYVQLARKAREQGWWMAYTDVVGPYVAFENEASAIQTFEPCRIPGLLQTEDYARALIQSYPAQEPDEVERRVVARLERQKILESKDAPELWAIVDESALYRRVGTATVMRDQLHHLLTASASPRVTLQVVPLAAGAHSGMDGAFVVLRFSDSLWRPVVYLENAADGMYPEDAETLHLYEAMFERLRAVAASPRDSVAMVEDVIGKT